MPKTKYKFGLLFKILSNYEWFSKISSSSSYGMNEIIKQYANLPEDFPFYINLQHGWTACDQALNSDLNWYKGIMFCWNKRYKESWQKNTKRPCEIIGAPFVHYRRMNKIEQSKQAKGTIAFPAHSNKIYNAEFNIEDYCQELKNLDEKFKPITICLHPFDKKNGANEIYEKHGFEVISASDINPHKAFYENFYEILRQYKYSTSNELGSYIFFSVEMGIPFFLLGELPVHDNSAGINIDVPPTRHKKTIFKAGQKTFDLFYCKDKTKISTEQKDFVESELGINDCISSEELNKLCWKHYGDNISNFAIVNNLYFRLIEILKNKLKK